MAAVDDPRVFLAAERSLLAWNRTCLAMMGFGFVIERFGLFLTLLDPNHTRGPHPNAASFWVGLALMVFSSMLALFSTLSFRAIVSHLEVHQLPTTRFASLALIANVGIAIAGLVLTVYLIFSTH
jgi:putative membrane protein